MTPMRGESDTDVRLTGVQFVNQRETTVDHGELDTTSGPGEVVVSVRVD